MPEEVMVCPECDENIEDWEESSVLECGNCGETFNYADEGSTRCQSCGKFSAKLGDGHEGCTGLNEDAEQKWKCDNDCGNFHDTEEEAVECDKDAKQEAEESSGDASRVRLERGDLFIVLKKPDIWSGDRPHYLEYKGRHELNSGRKVADFDTFGLSSPYQYKGKEQFSWGRGGGIMLEPKIYEKDGKIETAWIGVYPSRELPMTIQRISRDELYQKWIPAQEEAARKSK